MNLEHPVYENDYISMLESSKYICEKTGLDMHAACLPAVLPDDVERCKNHVSGHIHLMRRSTPEYYSSVLDVLTANKSVLLYLHSNFDVFGRYGYQPLKDELSKKNLCLGTNLSEKNAGTNAAVLASRSPKSAWVVGDEHYMDVL